ncbi:hypothetical protein MNBD_ALPHA12-49 [hydrothermal vent metagenome]|uniref:DUF1192 domain-containing protein n=1 Tax=hydrothermal vent metagenome TaxID=652676 RepID=A0A3B0U8Q3_9ZZZZ
MDEETITKKSGPHHVGMALDRLSIDELEVRIGLLKEEIERLRLEIKKKDATRSAAENVFKL